jgi:hypothetical protein
MNVAVTFALAATLTLRGFLAAMGRAEYAPAG